MSLISREGEDDDYSQVSEQNNYILKAHDQRRKIAKGVVFGDEVSTSDKSLSLRSNQSSKGLQKAQHDSQSSSSNKNQSKGNSKKIEEKKVDKQEQKREAEKRLIEEEIQRKNLPLYNNEEYQRQEQGQQQFSSGLDNLDFNKKSSLEKRAVLQKEKIECSNPKQQKQAEQAQQPVEEIRQQQIQIQFLKQKLQRLSIFNQGHIHPIIKAVSDNNKIIQLTQKRFQDQNTILSQFKEETSKKLEENIKNTLKQKMNEMNRENAKELKDIKNMSLFIQELLQKYSTRMDKMQKNIDELIKNNQNK